MLYNSRKIVNANSDIMNILREVRLELMAVESKVSYSYKLINELTEQLERYDGILLGEEDLVNK
jgi:hypothetical protein